MSLQSHIFPVAQALCEQIADLDVQRTALVNALKAAQLLCHHDWKHNGEDSHHRFFICKQCFKEDTDLTI